MTTNMDRNTLMENSLREALDRNSSEMGMCQEYKNDLQMATRNLQSFQNRLRVDVMVPIGSHALMPGYLYHTNEVLIGKPSGVFIESTTNQALDIVQRRMKVADKRLKDLEVEAGFFRDKLEYPQQQGVFSNEDQKEIIEEFDEEAEKKWRVAHRQKVKEAKLKEREERNQNIPDQDDLEELMEQLDELELMEELQDEFNSIVEPDPIDLTGQIAFKEKPRTSYELDSFIGASDEQTSAPEPDPKAPLSNTETEKSEASLSAEPPAPKQPEKSKRKSLQFSDDLERVKLIRKMDRPSTLITNYDPELTLQLKFRHSPVEYHPPKSESQGVIQSPVDIYSQFAHCMKHWAAPSTPDDNPRSILKKTKHAIPVDKKAQLVSAEDDLKQNQSQVSDIPSAGGNIYEQVIGDVMERNVQPPPSATEKNKKIKKVGFGDDSTANHKSTASATQEEPKRVSRFKAMRSWSAKKISNRKRKRPINKT